MKTPSIVLCQSPLRPSRRADSSHQSAERRRNSDEGGLHPVRPIHPSPNPWKPAQPNKGPTFRVFGVFRGPPPKKSHFPRTFSCNGCNGRTGSWTPPLLHVKINQKTMKPFSRAFLSALHRAFAVHPLWPSAIGDWLFATCLMGSRPGSNAFSRLLTPSNTF